MRRGLQARARRGRRRLRMMSEIPGLLLTLATYAAFLVAGHRLAVWLRLEHAGDRAVLASALLPIALVATTLLLGSTGCLTRWPLVAINAALVAAVLVGTRGAANAVAAQDAATTACTNERDLAIATPLRGMIGACVLIALFGALASASLLETWAWDSLGYHLPIAHDALQVGRLREVPGHVAYINTYPRFADLVTTAHRILLGHERFVELSQWPFLPLFAAVGFRIATRLGLARPSAWAIAASPIALPIVYLQCATSYVDVAYAALLLGGLAYAADRTSRTDDRFATMLLGLALATKPSAPTSIVAGLGALALAGFARRDAGAIRRLVVVGLGAALVGGKVYLENVLRFGNPVWPVALRVGPLQLPGYVSQAWILALGVSPEEQRWSWLRKLATSWFLETRPYVFDMRFGGFGPVFAYAALPLALLGAWRSARVRTLLFTVGAASLAQAGAFTSRYTIALAALVLVVAGATLARFERRRAFALQGAFALALAMSTALGAGGFTDGGPSLASLARMPERTRARRVALDDHGDDWFDIREETKAGEAFGYDLSFGLPSMAMRPDGASRLVFLGDVAPGGPELEALVDRERIRFLAVDRRASRSLSPRFRTLFASSFDDAVILEVGARDEAAISANP
jgi:hypothetical protein